MAKIYATEFAPGDTVSFNGESTIVDQDRTFLWPAKAEKSESWNVDPTGRAQFTVTRKRKRRDADGVESETSITFVPWKYQAWAIIDLETTGIEEDCKIVEIAIVRMRFGRVLDVWSTLVNPGVPIPSAATAVHGIDDAMVAGKPTMADLHETIAQKLEGVAIVAAYNGYWFDEKVLAREGVSLTVPMIDPMVICKTKAVSGNWTSTYEPKVLAPEDLFEPEDTEPEQRQKPGGKYRLINVAEKFDCVYAEDGVDMELHRAAWDSVLAGRILWEVREWCGADARSSEAKLREESMRQRKWLDEFKKKMDAKDKAKLQAMRDAGVEVVKNNRQWLKQELDGLRAWYGEQIEAMERRLRIDLGDA